MKITGVRTVWTLVLVLSLAGGLAAQEAGEAPGWDVTLVGEGGVFYSTRDLGKTVMTQPDGRPAQMRTHVYTSPIAALGVEIQSPWEALRLRIQGRTTLAGGVRGQLGGCELLTPEEAQGACLEVDSDGSVRSFTAGLMFIRRQNDGERFRPYLTLDAGLRMFSFDDESCGMGDTGDPSWIQAVCAGQAEITEDQTRAVLQAGLGARVTLGRAAGYVHLSDAFGGYEVDEGQAEGETQNAILFTVGVAYPLGR